MLNFHPHRIWQAASALSLLLLSAGVVHAQPGTSPLAGDQAPNFKLKTVDGSREIELAEFDRPVVLFFGSFT